MQTDAPETKVILVTAQKGGVGKSTLSFLIAKFLSESFKVGIIDLDNQGSFIGNKKIIENLNNFTIHPWNDLENNPEIFEFYDYLIIDTPPYNIGLLKELFNISDFIVVPIKMEDISITSVLTTLNNIKEFNVMDKTLIVPSMVVHNRNYSSEYEIIDDLGFARVEASFMQYSILTKVFLNDVVLDGNVKTNTDNCINDILTFINN